MTVVRQDPGRVTTRFAPSPTGLLHLGHAFSALLAHDIARAHNGRFLVRLEDIDRTRCRPEFTDAILEDMDWLGILGDETPRKQSEHLDEYRAALDDLMARDLLYPCFCSRADIASAQVLGAPHGPDGLLYPGTCRTLSRHEASDRMASGMPYALRLNTARAVAALNGPLAWQDQDAGLQVSDPNLFGDVVLARKETPTSYHLSVTLDDALQGVTHVVRGTDLFAATHIHRLLQALFQLPTPHYIHHTLISGSDGRRLAKRDQSQTLAALRAGGETPESIRVRLGLYPTAVENRPWIEALRVLI